MIYYIEILLIKLCKYDNIILAAESDCPYAYNGQVKKNKTCFLSYYRRIKKH